MANLKNLIGKALNRATSSKPSDDGGRKGYNYNAPASAKTPKPEALGGYKKPSPAAAPVKAKKKSSKERYEENLSMTRKAIGDLNKMTSEMNAQTERQKKIKNTSGFTPDIGKKIQANQKESLKYKKY